MKTKCLFGVHSWDGSKCSKCGETRNDEHKSRISLGWLGISGHFLKRVFYNP